MFILALILIIMGIAGVGPKLNIERTRSTMVEPVPIEIIIEGYNDSRD